MAIENIVYHIPKESYDYVIKDGFVDDINNYLLDKLSDCVMRNLVAESEIVIKLSELYKEEFTPTNSIQFKRQILWKPLVRCGECKCGTKVVTTDKITCILDRQIWEKNDFCSYGERANADQHTQSVESVEQEEWIDWRDEQEYEDRWERRTDE